MRTAPGPPPSKRNGRGVGSFPAGSGEAAAGPGLRERDTQDRVSRDRRLSRRPPRSGSRTGAPRSGG